MKPNENPKKSGTRRVVSTLLLAGLILTAPGAWAQRGGSGSRGDDDSETTRGGGSRDLRVSIATDRTQYAANRAVEITLRATNIGSQRVGVALSNEFPYDITIRDSRTGATIWQWSRTRDARRERGPIRLEPGDTRTFRQLWDQTDLRGRRVAAGTYRVDAEILRRAPVTTRVFLAGSDDRDTPRPGPLPPRPFPTPGAEDGASLQSDLRVADASVRAGDTVRATYVVTNRGRSPRNLRFSSGQRFDMVARAERGNRQVWRWSAGRMFTQALAQTTLNPGEQQTFTAEWRTDRDLPAGTYELSAFLTPMGEREGAYAARTRVRVESRSASVRDEQANSQDSRFPRPDTTAGRAERFEVRVQDLYGDPRAYLDKRVLVTGVYRGWQGGNGAPPVRRGDWVLESGDRTMYVTGAVPYGARVGEKVSVQGTIRRTEDGRLYLERN